MSEVNTMIHFSLCGLFLFLLIPILIGIYVYRDASRRRMNAVLWTFVSVAAPVFVGFIIYLLVRGEHAALVCPSCGEEVTENYIVCPLCGVRLKMICKNCGFPAEEGWKICPRCGKTLDKEELNVTPPVHRKDTALWKLLLAVALIPIIFFLLLCGVSISYYKNIGSSSVSSSYSEEDIEGYTDIPEVWNWIVKSKEKNPEGIYVLHYQEEIEEYKASMYLVYRPSAGNMKEISTNTKKTFFNDWLVVFFEDTDDPNWAHTYSPMSYFANYGNEYLKLEIWVNGEKMDYEITEIDFDPVLENRKLLED